MKNPDIYVKTSRLVMICDDQMPYSAKKILMLKFFGIDAQNLYFCYQFQHYRQKTENVSGSFIYFDQDYVKIRKKMKRDCFGIVVKTILFCPL